MASQNTKQLTMLEEIEGHLYDGIDTLNKLKECIAILDIEKRLKAFNVAVKTISTRSKEGGAGYYILLLDLERRVINLRGFNKNQIEEATNIYNEEEQKYSDDKTKDLVLVSAGSLLGTHPIFNSLRK